MWCYYESVHKSKKKVVSALLAIGVLLLFISVPASASSSIDRSKLGSITLHMSSNDLNMSNALSGIGFTIYKVAFLSNDGKYYLTNDFLGSGILLDKLSSAHEFLTASQTLANYVSAKSIKGNLNITDGKGIVEFKKLTLGYYFIMQTVTSSKHNNCIVCDPFLIAVPMKRCDNKNWIYDIIAYPKSDMVYGSVLLEKVNDSGVLLSGAVFRLDKKVYSTNTESVPTGVQTGNDKNGKYYWSLIITELVTDHNGQIAVKNMPFGQYRFIETAAPVGYLLDMTPHEFTISETGSVALTNGKFITTSGTVQTITIYNYDHYHPMPTTFPTPITPINPTTETTPTNHPIATKVPAVPTITDAPKELDIINKHVPGVTKPPKNKKKPKIHQKKKILPTGFNLPKTGGSKCYLVCTYGGIVFMISGIIVFVISRKK